MVLKKERGGGGGKKVFPHTHTGAPWQRKGRAGRDTGVPLRPPGDPRGSRPLRPAGDSGEGAGERRALAKGWLRSPPDEGVRLDARSPAPARPLPPAPPQPPAEGRGLQTAAAAEIPKKSTFFAGSLMAGCTSLEQGKPAGEATFPRSSLRSRCYGLFEPGGLSGAFARQAGL